MSRLVVGRRVAFTLLELLIVTGLMASLAAFSWPSVRRSLARAERLRAVESVRALLAEARSRALTRGRPHLLRIDDRRREMDLFEIGFDEADADQFQQDPGQNRVGSSRRSAKGVVGRPLQTAAIRRGGMRPQAAAGLAAEPHALAGPELKLVESRDLPENFRCREALPEDSLYRGSESMLSGDELADSLPANTPGFRPDATSFAATGIAAVGIDATGIAATGAPDRGGHFVQIVFDVAGRTADLRLEICGRDGYCTPLSVSGALGNVQAGTPYRHRATNSAETVSEGIP